MEEEVEIWKDVIGYEGMYEISNLGRVKSLERTVTLGANGHKMTHPTKILKTFLMRDDYPALKICKNGKYKTCILHRLVAQHFIPNPNNLPEVNHLKGVKTDCRASQLEWSSKLNNVRHAFQTGLVDHTGPKNSKAKFTWLQIQVIREAIAAGHQNIDVANYFKVKDNTISNIKSRHTWKNPPVLYGD